MESLQDRVWWCSKDRGGISFRQFFAKRPAFKEYNAAIEFGFKAQRHFRIEAVPGVDFDRADGDLSRSPVKRTIFGLKIGQDPLVGVFSSVANSNSTELALN